MDYRNWIDPPAHMGVTFDENGKGSLTGVTVDEVIDLAEGHEFGVAVMIDQWIEVARKLTAVDAEYGADSPEHDAVIAAAVEGRY